jgi:hypothetical protein
MARYIAPKAIATHPAVEACTSGEAGGSDYKHEVWLRDGWRFTRGRAETCRTLFCHTVAEFKYAKPQRVEPVTVATSPGSVVKTIAQLVADDVVLSVPYSGPEVLPLRVLSVLSAKTKGYKLLEVIDANGTRLLVPVGHKTNTVRVQA